MAIRFLLDQNVSDAVAEFLHSRGHEVVLGREAFSPEAPDSLLMVTADIEGLVVVSHDKDFGKISSLFPPGYRGRFEKGAGRLLLSMRETHAVHRLKAEIRKVEFNYEEALAERKRLIMEITETGYRVTTNSPRPK